MSNITCSLCRCQGHNRRNHRCPVNMYTTLSPDDPMRATTRTTIGLLCEVVKNITILDVTLDEPPAPTEPLLNKSLKCFVMVNIICQKLTETLRMDATLEVPIINSDLLLVKIRGQVHRLNTMLQTQLQTEYQVVITLTRTLVTANLHYPDGGPFPSFHIHRPNTLKRTSAYLKEMSVAIDLTVENTDELKTCTICMDDLAVSDTVTTNCNHAYCSTCIKTLSTHIKDNTSKPTCSMCRGQLIELRVCNSDIYTDVTQHIEAL
jgi:hypothetical protein